MTTTPAWLYNEFQHVGTDFEDTATVEEFDRNQRSSNPDAERELVAQLGISAGDSVIDFGCGTGTFAIQAALVKAQVIAIDVSQAMLNAARHKALQAGVLDQIQFHHSGFLTYKHEADPVDVIITKFALHHLPDVWKMVALLNMASLLRESGIFYMRDTVFSFPETLYQTSIDAWIHRVAKSAGEGWTRQDFEAHVREEYTTFGWILEQMLQRAGLEIEVANYITAEYAEYRCRKGSATLDTSLRRDGLFIKG